MPMRSDRRVQPRRNAFLVCLAATLVVHGVCAAAAAGWSARIDGGRARAADKLQAVFVAMPPEQAPPPAPDLPAPTAGNVPSHDAAEARSVEPPIDLSHFLPLLAVDTPAMPKTDWQIDLQSLDRLGASRIVFEILVDEHGQVLRCRLEEPVDAPSDLAASLQSALQLTPMVPAVRRGSPVASLRRIELLLAP